MLWNKKWNESGKLKLSPLTNILLGSYTVVLFKGAAHSFADFKHLQLKRGCREEAKDGLGGDVGRCRPRGGLLLREHPAHPPHQLVLRSWTLLGLRLTWNQLCVIPRLRMENHNVSSVCTQRAFCLLGNSLSLHNPSSSVSIYPPIHLFSGKHNTGDIKLAFCLLRGCFQCRTFANPEPLHPQLQKSSVRGLL